MDDENGERKNKKKNRGEEESLRSFSMYCAVLCTISRSIIH